MKRGYEKAYQMRKYTDRKGGYPASPDGFDRSDPGTLASRVDQWFEWLRERAYSEKTVDKHTWALRSFLGWSRERSLDRPEQIGKPMLENYQRWLFKYRKPDGAPLGIGTQRSRLGSLQQFFAWLCRANLLDANPASDLELPRKQHRRLPRALSREEIERVMALPDTGDPLGLRDRAVLELFYATGVRRSELIMLDVEDIDADGGSLRVRRGKGGKDRVVPVGERALHWVGRYLDECRPLLLLSLNEHALFITGYGERFSSHYVGNWVRRQLDAAGVEKSGACHLFRHSCATHMLENGADIRFIQQMLGHARLETTQIYTEVSIRQLREVHARTHPSGRLDEGEEK